MICARLVGPKAKAEGRYKGGQTGIEGLNPDLWDENDYGVIEYRTSRTGTPDVDLFLGQSVEVDIYARLAAQKPKGFLFLFQAGQNRNDSLVSLRISSLRDKTSADPWCPSTAPLIRFDRASM